MNSVNKWVAYAVILVVLTVWASAYIVSIFDHTYVPPKGLTEVMLAIAGFALSGKFIFGNQTPPSPPPEVKNEKDQK